MDCKYLHTTIQPSQKILLCIQLQDDNASDDVCQILLVYTNYVRVLLVDNNSRQSVSVTTSNEYPLFVPITWCCIIGEHIAAISSDAHLIMLDAKPPFSRVSIHQLATNLSPSTIPVAHCASSPNGEMLVACGLTENCVVASFDSKDNPSLKKLKLPDFLIHKVVPTQEPTVFVFLVSTKKGKKFLVHFDLDTKQEKEKERREVPKDIITIASIFDSGGYSKIVLFTPTSIEIGDNVYEVGSRVYSWFVTPSPDTDDVYIIVQLLDQSVYVFFSEEHKFQPKGKLPLISTFCNLSNSLLFCISDEDAGFFLPVSSRSITSNLELELLPKTVLPLIPRITSAFFHKNRLVVSSGKSVDQDMYATSMIYNTISFSLDDIGDELTIAYKKFKEKIDPSDGDNIRFFVVDDEEISLIASSKSLSMCLIGNLNISSQKTIAIGKFNNDILQIYEQGLLLLSGKQYKAPFPITAAAIGDDICVVSFKDDNVRLFDKNLNVTVEKKIPNAHAFAFCLNNIAIAADSQFGGNSTLTLYSFDLIPTDDIGQLTSHAYVMLFQPSSQELYVSTTNGTVSRWIIGNDFSNSCSLIYSGTIPPLLYRYGNDHVLIVSDKTYLFSGVQMLYANIPNPAATCTFKGLNDIDKVYVVDKDESIKRITLDVGEKDFSIKSYFSKKMTRKAVYVNDNSFLSIEKPIENDKSDDMYSTVSLISDTPNQVDLTRDFNGNFDSGQIPISVECIKENLFAIGVITNESSMLAGIRFTPTEGFSYQFSLDVEKPVYAIKKVDDIVFFGEGNKLRILIQNFDSPDKFNTSLGNVIAQVPYAVSFIEAKDNILWIGDRIESVFVYRYETDIKAGDSIITKIDLIAADVEPRQLTAMCLIDSSSVAVGEKNGRITFLRLQNDDIGDPSLKWRVSPIPDRGISLSKPVGQLIKVATYSVNEAVTSLLISPVNNSIFYTTLLGQIGAFLSLENEEDYIKLLNAELIAERLSTQEFGFTLSRKFPKEKICVVTTDILDHIDQMTPKSQQIIETSTNTHWQNLFGLICIIKQKAKF